MLVYHTDSCAHKNRVCTCAHQLRLRAYITARWQTEYSLDIALTSQVRKFFIKGQFVSNATSLFLKKEKEQKGTIKPRNKQKTPSNNT